MLLWHLPKIFIGAYVFEFGYEPEDRPEAVVEGLCLVLSGVAVVPVRRDELGALLVVADVVNGVVDGQHDILAGLDQTFVVQDHDEVQQGQILSNKYVDYGDKIIRLFNVI